MERLTDLRIINEVQNEFTPSVISVVGTTKVPVSIRRDPRELYRAVKRNAYYTRTEDGAIFQVIGSTHFNILDARSGY